MSSVPLWSVRMHTLDGRAKDVLVHAGSMTGAARLAGSGGGEFRPVRVTRAFG